MAGRRIGGAVARNRARRLLREAWWAVAPRLREGHDLVLVARRPLAKTKAPELTAEIEGLLARAGVMRE
jgi:ribonuclease P protein component